MSKKLNRFSSSINFQSLNRHWWDLLNLIALHLDREGIKEREDGARGVGGAIIGGRRLIEGRLLFEEKRNTFFVLFFCLLLHRLAEGSVCRFIFFYMFNCTDPGLQLGDPAPTKTAQKPYPMGPHMLSGLYKGVNTPPPPPPPPQGQRRHNRHLHFF